MRAFKFLELPLEIQYQIIRFSQSELPQLIEIKPIFHSVLKPLTHLWTSNDDLFHGSKELFPNLTNDGVVHDYSSSEGPRSIDLLKDLSTINTDTMNVHIFEITSTEQLRRIIDTLIGITTRNHHSPNHAIPQVSIPVFVICGIVQNEILAADIFGWQAIEWRFDEDILSKIKTYWEEGTINMYLKRESGFVTFDCWSFDDIARYIDCYNLQSVCLKGAGTDSTKTIASNNKTLKAPLGWNSVVMLELACWGSTDDIKMVLRHTPRIQVLKLTVTDGQLQGSSVFHEQFSMIINGIKDLGTLKLTGFPEVSGLCSKTITTLEITPPDLIDVSCYTPQSRGRYPTVVIQEIDLPNLSKLKLKTFGRFPVISFFQCQGIEKLELSLDGFIEEESLLLETKQFFQDISILNLNCELDETGISLELVAELFPHLEFLRAPIVHHEPHRFPLLRTLSVSSFGQELPFDVPSLTLDNFPSLERLELPISTMTERPPGYFDDLIQNVQCLKLGSLEDFQKLLCEQAVIQDGLIEYFEGLYNLEQLQNLILVQFPISLICSLLHFGSPLNVGSEQFQELELVYSTWHLTSECPLLEMDLESQSVSSLLELKRLVLTIEETTVDAQELLQLPNVQSRHIKLSGFSSLESLTVNLNVPHLDIVENQFFLTINDSPELKDVYINTQFKSHNGSKDGLKILSGVDPAKTTIHYG
ncbi:hypothetical protein WICPIJ_009127 [Wickerhamomyces pijperi]|uniref:Uncharacterized protein n=1 Tax=Wickerhamomyces pijperi TaxID=599730 RepID=A0A9P8PRN3_WICPI|nr:hypothetical protein WICPIJ_009127 [Wickerhamomyces pijperi]